MSPIVKADRRYKPARVHEAWEAEALGQRFIVDTVQAALDGLLPNRSTTYAYARTSSGSTRSVG
jgi:hypothetical protein